MDGTADKTQTDSQRRLRALGLFFGIVVVAIALSSLFATLLTLSGVPHDQASFLRMALLITLCVVVPLAAFAAQNDYRLSKYRDQLEQFASTDSLTGLLNRRFFHYRISEEIDRMTRTGETAALALFDLDDFKAINDKFGHKAGDAVLKAVSRIVESELRGPMDRVGRWGGEEFVFLLSNLTLEQAKGVCERVRERISNTTVYHANNKIKFTASFGVATLLPTDSAQDTIESADVALYQAKRLGRNKTVAAPERAEVQAPANVMPMRPGKRSA